MITRNRLLTNPSPQELQAELDHSVFKANKQANQPLAPITTDQLATPQGKLMVCDESVIEVRYAKGAEPPRSAIVEVVWCTQPRGDKYFRIVTGWQPSGRGYWHAIAPSRYPRPLLHGRPWRIIFGDRYKALVHAKKRRREKARKRAAVGLAAKLTTKVLKIHASTSTAVLADDRKDGRTVLYCQHPSLGLLKKNLLGAWGEQHLLEPVLAASTPAERIQRAAELIFARCSSRSDGSERSWSPHIAAELKKAGWTLPDIVAACTTQVWPLTYAGQQLEVSATKWSHVFSPSKQTGSDQRRFYIRACHRTWYCGCSEIFTAVLREVRALRLPGYESYTRPNFNLEGIDRGYAFLDGGFVSIEGNHFFGEKGAWVTGINALRYLCYQLGLQQPRKFKDEERIPTEEELLQAVKSQRVHAMEQLKQAVRRL